MESPRLCTRIIGHSLLQSISVCFHRTGVLNMWRQVLIFHRIMESRSDNQEPLQNVKWSLPCTYGLPSSPLCQWLQFCWAPHGKENKDTSSCDSKCADSEKLKKIELTYRQKQKQHFDRRHKAHYMTHLQPGEHAWVKDTSERGTVVSTAGTPRSYLVETPRGTLRRNRFHLPPTPKAPVTSELPDSTAIHASPCSASSTVKSEIQKICQQTSPCKKQYTSSIRAPPGYRKDIGCS